MRSHHSTSYDIPVSLFYITLFAPLGFYLGNSWLHAKLSEPIFLKFYFLQKFCPFREFDFKRIVLMRCCTIELALLIGSCIYYTVCARNVIKVDWNGDWAARFRPRPGRCWSTERP